MEDDKQLTNNEATETTHHRRRMSIFGIWSGIWKREGEIWIIGSGSTSSPYHTEMLWIRRKFDHSPQQNEFSSRWTQIKLVISTDVSELWRRKHDTFDRTAEVFGRSLENGAICFFPHGNPLSCQCSQKQNSSSEYQFIKFSYSFVSESTKILQLYLRIYFVNNLFEEFAN